MRSTMLILVFIVVIAFVGSAMAVMPGKTVEYPDGDQGKVIFDGTTHSAKQGLKCNDCHTDPFGKMMKHEERLKIKKEDHVAGKFCGKCHDGKEHNGKVVFSQSNEADCTKCHKKAEAPAPERAAPAPAPEQPAK